MKRLLLIILMLFFAGCSDNSSEDPVDSFKMYGISKDQVQSLIDQINNVNTGEIPVVLTDAGIQQVKDNLKDIEDVPVEDGEYGVLDTDKGVVIFKFYPDKAPNHCANFKKLANSGFYDWVLFHRVISGFMIQTGDINSKNDKPGDDGMGDPGYSVNAEFSGKPHVKGTVSMGRRQHPNSAGSQFFICHETYPSLDGKYSVFGNVVYGIEVIDLIASSKTSADRPLENIYIRKARVLKP